MMLPLEGVRVLDLSRLAPGPFCSMLLADMGADVLLVEPPPWRLPFPAEEELPERAAAYRALGRNKRSLVLNLQTQAARDIFYRLSLEADVVLEGFRPGVVERLGVDYATLRQHNHRIVYCSLTGYGQDGPYAHLGGHDINYVSVAGALAMMGWTGELPSVAMNVIALYAGGGLLAAFGILLALRARDRSGSGQLVDIAITDGILQLLSAAVSGHFASRDLPGPAAATAAARRPNYDVYECADGKWLSLGSLEPHFFANLCRLMGREYFIARGNDATNLPEIRQHFTEQFRSRPRDVWFAALREADVAAAPVHQLGEALADPHNLQRRMVIDVEAPGVGTVKQVGIAVKLSDTPGAVRFPAPLPGQHTDEVLRSLGYEAEDVGRLRAARVVA